MGDDFVDYLEKSGIVDAQKVPYQWRGLLMMFFGPLLIVLKKAQSPKINDTNLTH